jgi:hypothetical protein
MKRNGEFDDSKPGAKVAARYRHRVDRLRPKVVGDLPQLIVGHTTQIGGIFHAVEHCGF